MSEKKNRRQSRYGRLRRGWEWRTTPERLEAMEALRKRLGMDKTEFLENAIDGFIAKNSRVA